MIEIKSTIERYMQDGMTYDEAYYQTLDDLDQWADETYLDHLPEYEEDKAKMDVFIKGWSDE